MHQKMLVRFMCTDLSQGHGLSIPILKRPTQGQEIDLVGRCHYPLMVIRLRLAHRTKIQMRPVFMVKSQLTMPSIQGLFILST